MKTTCKDIRLSQDPITREYDIILRTKHNPINDVRQLQEIVGQGYELAVEVKRYRRRRSVDANAYCWVLCQKLAEKIGGIKEDIYKEAIRKAGQFDHVAVTETATEQFIKAWQSKGLGWYAEASESKIDGCKKVMVYYGSSVYDSKEMAHLIDYIVSECKEQGIETLPPWEVERLKKEWKS